MTVKSAQRIKGMMKNIEKDNNLDKRTDLMFKRAKLKRHSKEGQMISGTNCTFAVVIKR